jgi:hypothetical protein
MIPQKLISILIVFSISTFINADNRIDFISLGDWGGGALGGYHLRNTQNTAYAIFKHINTYDSDFIINSGDNFYYCGIQNISDPQINQDYTAIFGHLNIPWFNSLGNHDYGFNPEAQIDLNKTISNWILDNRYYHRKLNINNVIINIIVLDTNPCINDYRGDDRSKWDPCNYEFPTCGPEPGICKFHDNILEQDCSPQLEWFNQTVSDIPPNEWTIVIGHHPAGEINTLNFQPLLSNPKVHIYINGHVHSLQHYSIDNQAKYITTGAASMVIPEYKHRANVKNNTKMLFDKIETGFTSHTILDDNILINNFWNIDGKLLYSFNISK